MEGFFLMTFGSPVFCFLPRICFKSEGNTKKAMTKRSGMIESKSMGQSLLKAGIKAVPKT